MTLDQIRSLHAAGRAETTVDALRARVDAGHRDSETLLLYGSALNKATMFSQAMWPLRDAAKDPERFIAAMMQLASGAYVTGNHDLAIEHLSEVIEQEPENGQALTMRGMARLHSRRDYEGALEDIELALELDPEKRQLEASRVVALLGLKKVSEAREAIDAFADAGIVPEDEESEVPTELRALACVGRAKFAEEDGEKEKAEEYYQECAEAFPSQAIAVHEAMEFYMGNGEDEKFDAVLRAANEAAPQDRGFRIALARREQVKGNKDEARRILESAVESGYQGAAIDLAGFFKDSGDLQGALEQYRSAREMGASGGQFMLSFGEALIEAKEYDEALSLADDPGPESHSVFIRGRVALKRGEYERALESFTRGVVLWPDNAVARYYTALAAEQVGDFDRAVEEYRNALRIDANAADSRTRLAKLHLAERQPLAALYILRYQTHELEGLRTNLDEILLELEGIGWAGGSADLSNELLARISNPGIWGRAVASLAQGTRERAGIGAGIAAIKGADRLDLTAANSGAALRMLVEFLGEKGEHAEAIELAKAAALANPERAGFQAIYADVLVGADKLDEATAILDATLEKNPESTPALLVRGKLFAEAGENEKALEYFGRIKVDKRSSDVAEAEAAVLVSLGDIEEARNRLRTALEEVPYDGALALALAQLDLREGRKATDPAVAAMLRRAARFRGGEDANALLPDAKDSDS